ncbi:MAG TPA: ABC-type transport auxiliary lipoprotein family protein, partial [Polyangiales bacterium]
PASAQSASGPAQRLRLGRVSAARHIDRRFIERTGAHEIRYHDEWRWTDQPDTFLTRALSRDLFERAGLVQAFSGAAPTLDVELTALEQRSAGGGKRAYASVLAALHDDREQLWRKSFEIETGVGSGDQAEALADAMGKTLAQLCAQITQQTVGTLNASSPAPSD